MGYILYLNIGHGLIPRLVGERYLSREVSSGRKFVYVDVLPQYFEHRGILILTSVSTADGGPFTMLVDILTYLPGLSQLGGTITSIPIYKANGIERCLFPMYHKQVMLVADLTCAAKLPR